MATSAEPQGAAPPQNYVDFDEYIEFQLTKTQANIKQTEMFTTFGYLSIFVLVYVLFFVLLDHWAIPGGVSVLGRVLLCAGLVGASAGWLVWRVLLPYLKQVHVLYAARMIESADPALKSSLLNLVDLRAAGREISESVRRAMEKRAAVELAHTDVEQAVDRRPLLHVSYALLVVVAVCCLYVLFSPKSAFSSIGRLLLPTAHTPVATRTRIENVLPENTKISARTNLTVEADILGKVPEQVVLYYTTFDHKFVNQPVEMRRIDPDLPKYRGVVTGESGRGLQQSLSYSIVAGDARAGEYQVEVIQPPSAKVEGVEYQFPAYTRLESKTQMGGHIDALEGTKVKISATANMAVDSAHLLLTDSEDPFAKGEEIRMDVKDGTSLTAEWTLGFRNDGTYARFYHIQCLAGTRTGDPEPTQYNVHILADQRPDVTLVLPAGDIERPANAIVPMLIKASDPDFQLRYLTLRVEKAGEDPYTAPILEKEQPAFQGKYELPLKHVAKGSLKAGDEVQFWIEARDNKQPLSNRTNTPRLTIKITPPVTPKEVEAQLENDKREQQKLEVAEEGNNPRQLPGESARDEEDSRPPNARREEPSKPEDADKAKTRESKDPRDQKQNEREQNPDETKPSEQEQSGKTDPNEEGKSEGGNKPKNEGQGKGRERADEETALKKLIEKNLIEDQQKQEEEGKETEEGVKKDPSGDQKGFEKNEDGKERVSQRDGGREEDKPKSPNLDHPNGTKTRSDDQNKPGKERNSDTKESRPENDQEQPNDGAKQEERDQSPDKKRDAKAGKEPEKGESKPQDDSQGSPEKRKDRSEPPPVKEQDAESKPQEDGSASKKKDKQEQNPKRPPKKGENDKDGADNKQQKGKEQDSENPAGKDGEQSEDDGKNSPQNSAKDKQGKSSDKSQGGDNSRDKNSSEGDSGNDSDDSQSGKDENSKSRDGKGSGEQKSGKNDSKKSSQDNSKSSDQQPGGDESPSEDSRDAVKKKADGNETGEGTPDQKPDGNETAAKNKLDRKKGTDPATTPSKRKPEEQDGSKASEDSRNKDQGGESQSGQKPQSGNSEKSKSGSQAKPPKSQQSAADESQGPQKNKSSEQPSAKNPGEENAKDEEMKGKGSPDQKSKKPDTGEGGKNTPQSQGTPGSQQKGKGDQSNQPDKSGTPGQSKQAGAEKSGGEQPGSQSKQGPGKGKSGGEGKGKGESDKPGQGEGQGGGKGKGEGQSNKPGGTGSGNRASGGERDSREGTGNVDEDSNRGPGGGDRPGKGEREGDGKGNVPKGPGDTEGFDGEAPNLDYARNATDLVLKRLKDELKRGKVNQQLLDELGWTEEDMRRFTEKLEKRLNDSGEDVSPEALARRRQFESMLEGLNLNAKTERRKGNKTKMERVQEFNSRNIPAPPEYRDQYEAFTKELSKSPARQK